MHHRAVLVASLALACSLARAQSEPAPAEAQPVPWQLEFHPGIWYAGVGGDIKLPRSSSGTSSSVPVRDLNLDSPRISPYGEVNLVKGDWSIGIRGFGYSQDRTSEMTSSGSLGDVDFSPGTTLRSSLDVNTFEGEVGYRIVFREIGKTAGGGVKLRSDLRVLAGLRVIDIAYNVENTDGGAGDAVLKDSADEIVVHPLVGGRYKLDLFDDFTIHTQISVGGFSSSYGFDIVVGGEWRPFEHVGLQIGYRALFFGVKDGSDNEEFNFKGSLQGLYAGVSFSF